MRIILYIVVIYIFSVFTVSFNFSGKERYVVYKAMSGANTADIKSAILGQGGDIVKQLKYVPGFVTYLDETQAAALGAEYKVERDHKIKLDRKRALGCSEDPADREPNPNQPAQETNWGYDRMLAHVANDFTRGEGILVCVIDTGVDFLHPDLAENVVGGENFVSSAPDHWDDNDHGTHVAGIIAAADNDLGIIGIAPRASIFAAKVLDEDGSGFTSDVADGVLSCGNQRSDIINLSLGSDQPSELLESALRRVIQETQVEVYAAAGNDSAAVGWPAKYDFVFAISSSNFLDDISYFSNFGPEIYAIAPGSDIESTTKRGNYASFSGTSMATPFMAGAAALRMARGRAGFIFEDIGLTPEEQGNGLVNLEKTVE